MSYLGHVVAALATLAAVDLGWVLDRELPLAWVAVVVLAGGPYLLADLVARWMVRGRFRLGAVGERLLVLLPLGLNAIALLVLDWVGLLERDLGLTLSLESWPGLGLFLGLAPFLVYEVATIDALARIASRTAEGARRARRFQVRMLLSALLPLAVYLAFSSLVGQSELVRVHVEEVEVFSTLFTLLLVGVFVRFLPTILRRTWETAPLEASWMRSLFEAVAERAGFRYRELLVWRTGRQMSNAAIVGFTPRSRLVLFSDELLATLAPDELAAVFAHEIGHARRGHVVTFAALSVAILIGVDLGLSAFEDPSLTLSAGIVAAGLGSWYVALGWLSRRFELEADLESRELLGASGPLIRALERVTGFHARERGSWRYFSTARRVRFLEETELSPGRVAAFRKGLRRLSLVARLVCVVLVAAEALHLLEDWTAERVVAELRLARYDRAAALADVERGALDPDLVALTDLGARLEAQLGDGAGDVRRLDALARAAFAEGDVPRARLLVELALLRDARELEAVRDALEAVAADEPFDPDGLPEAWRDALGD